MTKKLRKIISILLCVVIFANIGILATAEGAPTQITLRNPYKDVIWQGDNAWTGYKGSLHTHSTYSDADVTLKEMVTEYYNQGFGFLAMADHAVTGVEWDKAPANVWIYSYQPILGYQREHFTTEEYQQIQAGTYPMPDGQKRDFGLTCVTGANELNALTLTKCHVVGYDLPSNVGNGHGGKENGHREAVEFAAKNGGYSVIAHPGDWFDSNRDFNKVYNEEYINYFADILLDNDSCLGMEVFNETNNTTPFDRVLWDNVLMKTLPYGRNVIAFGNSDAHILKNVDSSFSVFMMPDNSMDSVRETMHSGAFFISTRKIHANPVLGPAETLNVIDQKLPVPMATNLEVEGSKVKMEVENANLVQWVANGKVIAKTDVNDKGVSEIDLSKIEGSEDFLYVRGEIYGEGGCTCSQAFVVEKDTYTYAKDTSCKAKLEYCWQRFTSNRFFIIIQELVRLIVK